MILAEKNERKVYVNQEDFVSHIQPPKSTHMNTSKSGKLWPTKSV